MQNSEIFDSSSLENTFKFEKSVHNCLRWDELNWAYVWI